MIKEEKLVEEELLEEKSITKEIRVAELPTEGEKSNLDKDVITKDSNSDPKDTKK